jgi:predicted AAA+ superfamily ATPase
MKYSDEFTYFLETTNPWWEDKNFRFNLIKRDFYLDTIINDNKLIKSLVGARRVGKTSILFTIINELLTQGINPKKIIYLNSDLREIKETGIRNTLEHIKAIFSLDLVKDELFILIDEIQELSDWQNEIKFLYDSTKIRFYISGSSATLLAQKTSKLTGRYELIRVLPLSLKEYIKFNKLKTNSGDKQAILENYLLNGGYPEKVGKNMPGYLKEIVDNTLYRDLLETYKIRNPRVLEDILKLLADKITTPVSSNRIAKDLKIDNETAANYLKYLEAVYLVYPLYRNSGSNRISLNYPPKYYFNDTGILNELGIRPRIGYLAENAVFIEFLRRQFSSEKYSLFYEVIEDQEFDFGDGKNIFEVKFKHKTEDNLDLLDYELKNSTSPDITKPIIIGNIDIKREITNKGINVSFKELYDFLIGV